MTTKNEFTIRNDIQTKLDRMSAIDRTIIVDEGACMDDGLREEYRSLQKELVPVFLRLVRTLMVAGLLTVSIDIENEPDIEKFSYVTGEPARIFENGNIWIDACRSGGGLTKAEMEEEYEQSTKIRN